ncbi:MAG: YfhO family protein, partial [Nitrososphaerales archaeon]
IVVPSGLVEEYRAGGFTIEFSSNTSSVMSLDVPAIGLVYGEGIKVLEYNIQANKVIISLNNSRETDAVTRISYDRNWVANVDGKAAELFKTDLGFIKLPLKSIGDHTIVLEYKPMLIFIGFLVSSATLSMLSAIGIAVGLKLNRKEIT